jgi:galactose-1-phosphate uridylyltransferase
MEDHTLGSRLAVLEARLEAQATAIKEALISSDKAITKAELATEKRLEGLNEFRSTLSDQQKTFAVKSEIDYRFAALADRIGKTEVMLSKMAGKGSGYNAAGAIIFSVIVAGCTIGGLVLTLVLRTH